MKTLAPLAFAFAATCAVAQDVRNEPVGKDMGSFLRRLLKVVPAGAPVADARAWLESRGFGDCTDHIGEVFSKIVGKADFIVCTRASDGQVYQVALFHDGPTFLSATVGVRGPQSPRPPGKAD